MWAGMLDREDSGWREKRRCQDSSRLPHSGFKEQATHPQRVSAYLGFSMRFFQLSPFSTIPTTVTESIFYDVHMREPQ